MDKVDFKIYIDHDEFEDIDWELAEIIVNGQLLSEHLQEYERRLISTTNPKVTPGQYKGISPYYLYEKLKWVNYGSGNCYPLIRPIHLFQCGYCYSEICVCDFYMNLVITEDTVTFDNYKQIYNSERVYSPNVIYGRPNVVKDEHELEIQQKRKWDYRNFQEFTFDRKQFVDALAEFKKDPNFR